MPNQNTGPDYVPTPEQIAEETAKIRAEWSEVERCKRSGYSYELRPISNRTTRAWGGVPDDVELVE